MKSINVIIFLIKSNTTLQFTVCKNIFRLNKKVNDTMQKAIILFILIVMTINFNKYVEYILF